MESCYLVITTERYPFGGAEEYVLELIKQQKESGANTYWITFKENNKDYMKYDNYINQYCEYTVIDKSSRESIHDTQTHIDRIKPTKCYIVCSDDTYIHYNFKEYVKVSIGLHFWREILNLNNIVKNNYVNTIVTYKNILDAFNYKHSMTETLNGCIYKQTGYGSRMSAPQYEMLRFNQNDEFYLKCITQKEYTSIPISNMLTQDISKLSKNNEIVNESYFFTKNEKPNYLYEFASQYMLDVVHRFDTAKFLNQVNHIVKNPIILEHHKSIGTMYDMNYKFQKNKFVTIIDTNHYKGGNILMHVLDTIDNSIKFKVVENMNNNDDSTILINLLERTNVQVIERQDDITKTLSETRILIIPSLTDETFGRIVIEALKYGIPVFSSGNGNIGTFGVLDLGFNPIVWKNNIEITYHNENKLLDLSKYSLKLYDSFLNKNICINAMNESNSTNSICLDQMNDNIKKITFVCPIAMIGLFFQTVEYIKCFMKDGNKYLITIINYKPFNMTKDDSYRSKQYMIERYLKPICPNIVINDDYYDKIENANLTNQELDFSEYCKSQDLFIVIELDNIYSNFRGIFIPNVEALNKTNKLFQHQNIVANNDYSYNLLTGILKHHNVIKYNFGIENNGITKTKEDNGVVKFCIIGGDFKEHHRVVEAFYKLLRKGYDNFHLTVVLNNADVPNDRSFYKDNSKIKFWYGIKEHDHIINIYKNSDVSIIMSLNEGLGMNFYESMSVNIPVLTHNGAPHNEIITNNENGWLIDCDIRPMDDKLCPLFYFNENAIETQLIELLGKTKEDFDNMFNKTYEYNYKNRNSKNRTLFDII